ncbi:hypothetical protein BvCmsKSP064_05147 [Escherichia coli]|nr:hypothetical protein BvCms28BK_05352 [Escherichia coli]GCI09007.1 hypothetical protein BvCmsSIP0822_05037 [Escherichia coli]GDN44565.1 hypothetical protein BvCmsKSP064_05147 [Escherichia coli]GDW51139.1 hypothetical protein BvCmsSIP015_05195 [Escherichia coli]
MTALNAETDAVIFTVYTGLMAAGACQNPVIVHCLCQHGGIQGDFSTISIFTAQVPVFIAVTVQGVVKGAGLKRATQGKRTFFCGGTILCIHNPDTLSGGCHPEVTVSDICKRKPGFAGCLTTINHQLVRGIAAIKANTHIDGATLTGEVIGGQFMERYRGVAFCNSTAQDGILCRLIIKANLPCVNNIAGTDHITIQYHTGAFTELCSATQTSPGSQSQCSTMSDSGVASLSPGINRKAAAIFQQQAAGLTGYAINTELTAGIGPLNSGTTVCYQGTTGCHGDICCLTTGRHCQGTAVIHQGILR